MPLWFRAYTLEEINRRSQGTMLEHLGIVFDELGEKSISARMPVDRRTRQPAGLLHGGASLTLSESLASVAASLTIDPALQYCVGMEINANHLRPVTAGEVVGISTPVHLGRATQVWETKIRRSEDSPDKLVCISRVTMAILEKK